MQGGEVSKDVEALKLKNDVLQPLDDQTSEITEQLESQPDTSAKKGIVFDNLSN